MGTGYISARGKGSSSKATLMRKLGKRAYNQRLRNEFNLQAEKYNDYEEVRKKVNVDEDVKRAQNFLNELKEKRQKSEKQLKLEFQLIHYIFLEDDGKLSRVENRAINKHFKSYKGKISPLVLKELKDLKLETSVDGIANYVLVNEYDTESIGKAISSLLTITNSSERYHSFIKDLEKRLHQGSL